MFHPDKLTSSRRRFSLSRCQRFGKQITPNSGGLIPNICCAFQTIPSIWQMHNFWKDKGTNFVVERPKL